VGFDWHPVTKELYFATHGRELVGDDAPSDGSTVASRKGLHFGFPYCHQGGHPGSRLAQGARAGVRAAAAQTGPPRGRQRGAVYTGSMFPPEYRNRIFLAQRGSWNRRRGRLPVMMVTLRPRDVPKVEVFAKGWLQGDQIWGRPVYTQQMKDGSLLIADDSRARSTGSPTRP